MNKIFILASPLCIKVLVFSKNEMLEEVNVRKSKLAETLNNFISKYNITEIQVKGAESYIKNIIPSLNNSNVKISYRF